MAHLDITRRWWRICASSEGYNFISRNSKWDYLKAIYFRYRKASKPPRARVLDEICQSVATTKDYHPDRNSFVVEHLKKAGAVILAKSTLGEMAGGNSHGSLFGSTRNPYDLNRTVGGSSGGSAAAVTSNFCAVAIGQEGLASIRRPAAWTSVAGMRTTGGLVSRGGVYSGWPALPGSLGPITRTIADTAAVLDVIVGYDPEDPLTAYGVGEFAAELHKISR